MERQDLDEILGNLIENAAKYGGGSVFVTIDAVRAAKDCTIWIEDDGMGIPESARAKIFDRGARLDTGKPGTGLGLAIVRQILEAHGSTIHVESTKNRGTRFWFELPLAESVPGGDGAAVSARTETA